MFGGGGEPQYLDETGGEVAQRAFLVLEDLVRRGQEKKLLVAGDPTAMAQMIWAMVHGISTLRLGISERDGTLNPDFTIYCAQLLRDGLRSRT